MKVYQYDKDGLFISKQDYVVNYKGGEITLDIHTNVQFSVTVPTVDWLHPITTKNLNTYPFTYIVHTNDGSNNRSTRLFVTNFKKDTREVVTITQLQQDALVLAKSEYEFGPKGGNLDFEILTSEDVSASISNNATSWIKQVNTRTLDTITLHFNIEACTEEEREGTITISGGNTEQIIKISQRNSDHIDIPDPTFKAYCIENFDYNKDGEITTSEASSIINIDVFSDNIETLQGIEYFKNLEWLSAYPKNDGNMSMGVGGGPDTGEWRDSGYYLNNTRVSGKIKAIDISKNLKLKGLNCSGNLIESLDLTNNTSLEFLNASYNLDLNDIKFSTGDIKIKELKLAATSIQEINLSNFTELERLEIHRGLGLKSLDISKNTKLKYIDVAKNLLNSIDVSNNSMLDFLDCCVNPISSIDLSNNTELTYLSFGFSNVTDIDLSKNTKLKSLRFQNADLDKIDISMLPELQIINFGNYWRSSDSSILRIVCNDIKNIDLSKNTKLEELFASLLDLEDIDLSNNTELKRIFIEGNLFEEVDVSYSPKLYELSAYWNPNLSTIYITPEQKFTYSVDNHTRFAYKGEEREVYKSTDYSKDGEVKQLQTATKGDGIDIVLMGDAYSDRLIANGTYDSIMNIAVKKFFEVEPYKSFKEYFNVYSVTAVSENEVYNITSSTALSGYFGEGTLVGGNDSRAFEYAQKAIGDERIEESLIVVMMNSTIHAGTCWMYYPSDGDWSNGASVSYFPVGADSESLGRLIHHEAAGHGFAKLGDEYAYTDYGQIPSDIIQSHKDYEPYGWWKNVDFTSDRGLVKWARFLSDTRYQYDGLGTFEGGLTYWRGVWRPSDNSIMNTNTGGFNAPSREAIYYRIHKLAHGEDWQYNYEEFVEWDAVNRKNSVTTRSIPYRLDIPDDFHPTHPPIIVKNSWRKAKNNAPEKMQTRSASNNAGKNLRKADVSKGKMEGRKMTTISESGMIQRTSKSNF